MLLRCQNFKTITHKHTHVMLATSTIQLNKIANYAQYCRKKTLKSNKHAIGNHETLASLTLALRAA